MTEAKLDVGRLRDQTWRARDARGADRVREHAFARGPYPRVPAHDLYPHVDPNTRGGAASRLQAITGSLEGLLRTLEADNASCLDVLVRLKAVTEELGRVGDSVLRCHVRTHVAAARLGDADAVVEGLMEAIKYRP